MTNVLLDMAMSLDGLIAGPNDEAGGLHDYFFSPSGETAQVIQEGLQTTGALIMGRRMYNIGAEQDGFVDNPYPVPTFILTHAPPETAARGAETFTFVTGGIEEALQQAKAAAGDKHVVIGGGGNVARQFLAAGLVDEIQIHLVPVLLGEGIRLFGDPTPARVALESTRVIDASGVTHLRYLIVQTS